MFPHPICSHPSPRYPPTPLTRQPQQLSISVGWVCLFQTSVCAVWSWGRSGTGYTSGESCLRLAPSSSCPEPFSLLSSQFVDLGTRVCGRKDPPLPQQLAQGSSRERFAGVLACG